MCLIIIKKKKKKVKRTKYTVLLSYPLYILCVFFFFELLIEIHMHYIIDRNTHALH